MQLLACLEVLLLCARLILSDQFVEALGTFLPLEEIHLSLLVTALAAPSPALLLSHCSFSGGWVGIHQSEAVQISLRPLRDLRKALAPFDDAAGAARARRHRLHWSEIVLIQGRVALVVVGQIQSGGPSADARRILLVDRLCIRQVVRKSRGLSLELHFLLRVRRLHALQHLGRSWLSVPIGDAGALTRRPAAHRAPLLPGRIALCPRILFYSCPANSCVSRVSLAIAAVEGTAPRGLLVFRRH